MKQKTTSDDLGERGYRFALRIIELVSALPNSVVGRTLGGQLIRSGPSVGANIEEAKGALTRKDFIHSMNIAKKEARESKYWIRLITDAKLIKQERVKLLLQENEELIKILTSIVKSSQKHGNIK
jgi:four helix bundle protein